MAQVRKEYLRWIVVNLWLTQVPNQTLAAFKERVKNMLKDMTYESVELFRDEAREALFSGAKHPELLVNAVLTAYDNLTEGVSSGIRADIRA